MATTNTCKKCGCEDSFMPSPAPCPTPQGCPNPEPCSEVMDAQCVIYTGPNLFCNEDTTNNDGPTPNPPPAPIVTTNDTVAEAIENIVDYVCNNKPAYKVYTALLTQTGTDAPVATVLENTLGNIVWTRNNDGFYSGTLTSAFVTNKTALFIQDNVTLSSIAISPADVWIQRINANEIGIYTMNNTVLVDNVLNNTTIEIRVYN